MGRMISLKTMPGTWEGEVAEVMGSPWILMELERRDWSSLLTFSDSCSMVLSFSQISSRRATFSATRVEMDFSILSILASWLPKESNLACSLASDSSMAMLRAGGLVGEDDVSESDGGGEGVGEGRSLFCLLQWAHKV